MAAKLPSKIVIRGGLTSSERVANGVRFDHDDLAALASAPVEGPFVVDHSMGIDDIAGIVQSIGAERREIEVQTNNPEPTKRFRTDNATFLTREAVLTDDHPAFERAARHIMAMQKAGKVPHTSIALQASSIQFDAETEELVLAGPMRFIHDSLVSRGAFSPQEDGVGATEIQFDFAASGSEPIVSNASAPEGELVVAMAATGFTVTNMPELIAKFSIDNEGNDAAMSALAEAVVRESKIEEEIEPSAPEVEEPIDLSHSSAGGEGHPSNTPSSIDGDEGTMPEETQPIETQADGAVEPKVDMSAIEDNIATLAAEVKSLREAQAAEKASAFEAEKERVMAEYGVDSDTIAAFTSVEALRGAETLLRGAQTQNPPVAAREVEEVADFEADLPNVLDEITAFNAVRYGVGA